MKIKIHLLVLVSVSILNINAQIPTDGLVAEWLFEDNLSDTKPTGTPYDFNIVQGNISYLSGFIGKSLYLDGATKIHNTDQNLVTIINNKNPWTINFWFKYKGGVIPYVMGPKHLISIDQQPHASPYKRVWINTGEYLGCQTENYKPATYILKVTEGNKEIRTYQIVKH